MSGGTEAYGQALAYLEVGQPGLALPLLATHLASYPDHAQGLSYLAQALSQLGDPANAKDAAERSLALHPHNDHALRILAFSLAELGKLKEARLAAEEAQRVAPDYWLTHLTRARLDLGLADGTKNGRAAVARLLELAPDVAESHVVAADYILVAEGPVVYEEDRARARLHLEKALAIDPQDAAAIASMGRLELGTRWKTAEGARIALGALAQDPTNYRNRELLYATIIASIKWLPRTYYLLLLFILIVGSGLEADKETETLSGYRSVAVAGAVLALVISAAVIGRLAATLKRRTLTLVRAIPRVSRILLVRILAIAGSLLVLLTSPALSFEVATYVLTATIAVLVITGVASMLRKLAMS